MSNETTATPRSPASAGSAFIRVNYGIHRLQSRHLSHRSGKMRIKGDWSDDATHTKIKAIIRCRHPGWNITGWCLANTPYSGLSDGGARQAEPRREDAR